MTRHRFPGKRNAWLLLAAGILLVAAIGVHADPLNDTAPPRIISKAPQGLSNAAPVTLLVITDEPATCRYDTRNAPYPGMEHSLDGSNQTHNATITIPDGDYAYFVACKDASENVGDPENLSFTLDTAPPAITVVSPSGTILARSAELNVTTNEASNCKFDITDVPYESMASLFQVTNARSHKHVLTGLVQGAYNYFVRCKDGAGNTDPTSAVAAFTVNQRPQASISIGDAKQGSDGTPLLKAGTYLVHVTSSEELSEIPSLRYNFNDDANTRSISLTGSGVSYSGYMIIPDDSTERVGSFSISMVDASALSGTDITGGKIFLTSTKKPASPSAPEVENVRRGAKVTWFADGSFDYFKLYRSTTSSVSKADYYAQATGTEYTDTAVEDQKTYYYRVAAVDFAGNEGDLSPERFVVVNMEKTAVENQVKLSSTMQAQVKKKVAEIDKATLDIDAALLDLSMASDPDKILVIGYFGLVEKAKDAKASLVEMKSQLEGFLSLGLTDAEIKDRLSTADLAMRKASASVFSKVVIDEKADIMQPPESTGVYAATAEVLKGMAPSADERNQYESSMLSLNEGARVSGKFIIVSMTSLDKTRTTSYALVKKQVILPAPLKKGMALEVVPKDVAARAGDIIPQRTPIVLKDDPILKWATAGETTLDIAYHLEGRRDLNSLKSTRTIILEEPSFTAQIASSSENNSITGLAAKPVVKDTGSRIGWQAIVLFVGIACVVVLAVYYFFFMREEESFEEKATGEAALLKKKGASRYRASRRSQAPVPAAPSAGQGSSLSNHHSSAPGDALTHGSGGLERQSVLTTVEGLVKRASFHVDRLDMEGGQAFYLSALDWYGRLDEGAKAMAHPGLQGVYEGLSALALVKRGHELVDARAYGQLASLIRTLDRDFPSLPPGVRGHVERSLLYFRSSLPREGVVSSALFSPLGGVARGGGVKDARNQRKVYI